MHVISHGDDTLFIKCLDSGTVTILLVFIDNTIVNGNNEESKSLGQGLSTLFEIKFLGKMRYFLGIKAAYFNQGIFISQYMYTLDLIKETNMMDCKPSSNSVDPNTKLSLHEEDSPTNKRYYQIFVEKVIYLNYSRPNKALVVGLLSKLCKTPKKQICLQCIESWHI